MPEIEMATDQRAFLVDLITDFEAEPVGNFGAVRYQDALQFLIDQYREDSDISVGRANQDETDTSREHHRGEDRLEAMMSLLERHEEKWALNDGDERKYSVTLPVGATESVRTKDDVRALLFNHYG